jgi:hypothetical protein
MPTKAPEIPNVVGTPLSMRDLAAILIRHYGVHDGLYEPMIEFQMGFGAVGPDPQHLVPGAMIGVHRIGLSRVESPTPFSADATEVNPVAAASKARKKRS